MTIQEAHKDAQSAIDALAREGQRQASEHAYALDRLREEVAELRAINAKLRNRVAWLERVCPPPIPAMAPVDTEEPRREVVRGFLGGYPTHWSPDGSRYAQNVFPQEPHGWRRDGEDGEGPRFLTAEEKDRWLLDGVLP